MPVALEDFADPSKRALWIREHPATGVDLFVTEPLDFKATYERTELRMVAKGTAPVVGLDDLIQMKAAAGRACQQRLTAKLASLART